MEPRYNNEPLYNENLGITNDFLYPIIGKYTEKNLDITRPPYYEPIFASSLTLRNIQRAKTITDYRQNDLKITDYRQEKYNRLQTWADIVNICFQKKEHFAN